MNIFYCYIVIIILLTIILTFTALRRDKKTKTYILKELKRLKELYKNNNEIECILKGRNLDLYIYSFSVFLFIDSIFLSKIIAFNSLFIVTVILLITVIINIVIFILIYYLLNKNVKSLHIKDNFLVIKYGKSIKEYSINNIDKIKYRISSSRGRSIFCLYIKNKEDNEYDGYILNYYNMINMIALTIFIKSIKQNKVERIDIITEEEIVKIMNEFETGKLNEEEVKYIVR